MTVAVVCLVLGTLYGFSTWASIKIIDRFNTRNTMGAAIGVGVMFGGIVPFAGMMFAIFPLAGLFALFIYYYDLGILRAFLTVIVMGIILQVLGTVLLDMLGDLDDNTATVWGGVFAAGLIGGYVLRKRGIVGGSPEQQYERFEGKRRNEAMPTARATRAPKKTPAKPAPAKPAPAKPAPAPAKMPPPGPKAGPARSEPASEVAPQHEPTSLDDEPRFLT